MEDAMLADMNILVRELTKRHPRAAEDFRIADPPAKDAKAATKNTRVPMSFLEALGRMEFDGVGWTCRIAEP
jgi:hypothetical protein